MKMLKFSSGVTKMVRSKMIWTSKGGDLLGAVLGGKARETRQRNCPERDTEEHLILDIWV